MAPAEHTGCPSTEQIAQFAAGELSPEETERLGEHLATCRDCQARLAEHDESESGSSQPLGVAGDRLAFTEESQCDRLLGQLENQQPEGQILEAVHEGTFTTPGGGPRRPATPQAPPKRVGDYELLEPLGEGGMGAVYKARHAQLGTVYAVKLLTSHRRADRVAIERFEREMVAIGKLDHPNIVRAVDAGDEGQLHFLVMEFVDGIDLSRLVGRHRRLGVAEACELVRQAAAALDYVHRHGRVHRDVKPSNLMLASDGQVKLLDLGLAQMGEMEELPATPEERQALLEATGSANLTLTNQVMGTLEYMAPEQCADSRAVDARADIYSLGCTMYKLLAGRAPFGEQRYSTSVKQILAHAQVPPPSIRQERPDVPEAVAAILARMLAKKPEERYRTAAGVAEALAPFSGGDLLPLLKEPPAQRDVSTDRHREPTVVTAAPVRPLQQPAGPARSSPLAWVAGGALLLLLLLMAGGVFFVSRFVAQFVPDGPRINRPRTLPFQAATSGRAATRVPTAPALPIPADAGPPVDLLALLDLDRDAPPGIWKLEDGALISPPRGLSLLQIPYVPPESYRLEATVERLGRQEGFHFGVMVGGRQTRVTMDSYPDQVFLAGPERIDGRGLETMASQAYRGTVIAPGKTARLACTVVHDRGRALLRLQRDGEELFTWNGRAQQLDVGGKGPAAEDALFLRVWRNPVKITRLVLVPLSTGGGPLEFADGAQDPDRAAAERVLWKGGRVWVSQGAATTEVARRLDLPAQFKLERIDVTGDWFSDADLAALVNLSELQELNLAETQLTGAGLGALAASPKLHTLRLGGTPLDSAALASLSELDSLRHLELQASGVEDEALAAVGRLQNLESLDLRFTAVTDEGIAHLAELPRLAKLQLDGTAVTGAGIAGLAKPPLESLSLNGLKVTDETLAALAAATRLRELRLLGTSATAEAVASLREQLPEASVVAGTDEEIDLLPLVDLPWSRRAGSWAVVGGALRVPQAQPAKLALPIVPPEEYDLEAVVRREAGTDNLLFTLVAGGRKVMVGFDHWPGEGPYAILHGLDGARERDSIPQLKRQRRWLPTGQQVRLTLQVRRNGIKVLHDGAVIIDWQGDFHRFDAHEYYTFNAPPGLGLGAYNSGFTISQWKLRPVSGAAGIALVKPTWHTDERDVAEWARDLGAEVDIYGDGIAASILGPHRRVPPQPIWIRRIKMPVGHELSSEDFARLGRLRHLRQLDIGRTSYDPAELAQLGNLRSLRNFSALSAPVNDEALATLATLPRLEVIDLWVPDVGDEGIRRLAGMKQLKNLGIAQSKITDDAVESLAQLKGLRWLNVSGTQLTTDGMQQLRQLTRLRELIAVRMPAIAAEQWPDILAGLPQLTQLHVQRTTIDDRSADALAAMTGMKDLWLDGTGITDRGVARLAGLTQLEQLALRQTHVTEAGLRALAAPKLKRLHLDGATAVDDGAIRPLSRLKSLTELGLRGTGVTPGGVAQLRQSIPTCSISSSSPGFDLTEGPAPPAPAGKRVDLLAAVDLARDGQPDGWQRESDGSLVSNSQTDAWLQIPYLPGRDYRIEATVERLSGRDGIQFGVAAGGRQSFVVVDGWPHEGYLSGPHVLQGLGLERHKTRAYRGQAIPDDRPVELAVTVHGAGNQLVLRADRDDRVLFSWRGAAGELRLPPDSKPLVPRILSLRVFRSQLRISQLRVAPLSGGGRLIDFADPKAEPELAAAQRAFWKHGAVWVPRGAGVPQRVTTAAQLPEQFAIQRLDFTGSRWFSGHDLAHFAKLPQLRELKLPATTIRGEQLAVLQAFPRLQTLSLIGAEFDGESAADLASVTGLQELNLRRADIDDEALAAVGKLDGLRKLDLSYTQVSDAGLEHLAGLAQLTQLQLDHTAVSGQGLESLAGLSALEELTLRGAPLGADAVEKLAALSGLKTVRLSGTPLAHDDVAQLAKALPAARLTSSFDTTFDLLPLVDADWGTVRGDWSWQGGELTVAGDGPSLLMLPITPPEEYVVELTARRLAGRNGIALVLVGGGRQFLVEFDQFPDEGPFTVVDMIDGKRAGNNESHVRLEAFPEGRSVRVAVEVRRDRIVVKRNDQLLIDWPADYSRLTLNGAYSNPHPNALGIGAWYNGVAIEELKLRPLTAVPELIPARPTPLSDQRQLARWVQQQGGQLTVTVDGRSDLELAAGDALPERPLWVRRVGALPGVRLDSQQFAWLARSPQLTNLDLHGAAFDEAELAQLARCRSLTELNLNGTPLTDEGLARVARISGLKVLRLLGTKITDAGLPPLANLPGLTMLRLEETAVTDEGLIAIGQIKSIRLLSLSRTRVSPRGLPRLAVLPELRDLYLNGLGEFHAADLDWVARTPKLIRLHLDGTTLDTDTQSRLGRTESLQDLNVSWANLGDDGLRRVARIDGMTKLYVAGDNISDAGVRTLAATSRLEELSLAYNRDVTDASIPTLEKLTALRLLQLEGTRVTPEGVARLRQALPGCRVNGPEKVVDLRGSMVDDDTLAEVLGDRRPEVLRLAGTGVTDAAAPFLASLSELKELSLENTTISDKALASLAQLEQLESLNLNGTQVTDEGLAELASLNALKQLRLGRTAVTGTGFERLQALENLTLVQLGSAAVNAEGFAQVVGCKSLQHLDVAGAKIDDETLAPVAERTGLRFLHLGWTDVAGPGLAHLRGLKNLQVLQLTASKIDDAALEHVAALPALRSTHLAQTAVTGAGLRHLAQMPELRSVSLEKTQVTAADLSQVARMHGLRELKLSSETASAEAAALLAAALPRCRITRDGKPVAAAEDPLRAEKVAKLLDGAWHPVWAPDGERMLYGLPQGGLRLVNIGTGETESLLADGKDAAWSPDGETIAFVREQRPNDYKNESVWLVSAAGGAPRKLADACSYPTWIRGSSAVVCYSHTQGGLVTLDVGQSDPQPAPYAVPVRSFYCAVSPDEELIAYGRRGKLYVADRSTQQVVAELGFPAARGALPVWSPDGRYLAYGGYDGDPCGLWVYDRESGRATQLLEGAYTGPSWSPDGKRLAVDHRPGGRETWSVWTLEFIDAAAGLERLAAVGADNLE